MVFGHLDKAAVWYRAACCLVAPWVKRSLICCIK